MYKNDFEIDVMRCFRTLFKKKVFIILMAACFFVIGVGMTLDKGEDKYTSVAKVYAASDGSYSDAANAVTAMNAYLDVATSYKVCQRAALIMGRSDVSAGDIQGALTVYSSIKNANSSSSVANFLNSSATIISFSATTTDPELSREMADAAAESYVIEMANILKTDSVKSLDSADTGIKTVGARYNAWKTRVIYTFIGFVVACAIIVACEIFDRKVRTIREATIKNKLPVIGIIPDYKE